MTAGITTRRRTAMATTTIVATTAMVGTTTTVTKIIGEATTATNGTAAAGRTAISALHPSKYTQATTTAGAMAPTKATTAAIARSD